MTLTQTCNSNGDPTTRAEMYTMRQIDTFIETWSVILVLAPESQANDGGSQNDAICCIHLHLLEAVEVGMPDPYFILKINN